MRHSLYRYFDDQRWADAFLDGKLLFRSLSYFRDSEDKIRGDKNEGRFPFHPENGLFVRTPQGWIKTPYSFDGNVKVEEIFVYCMSRSFTRDLLEEFKAVACIEIFNIRAFCNRIESALPRGASLPGAPDKTRIGQVVGYRDVTENCNPTWACPDSIALSKHKTFARQDEYRLMFSLTDALAFENAQYQLTADNSKEPPRPAKHLEHHVEAGNLRDVCRLRALD